MDLKKILKQKIISEVISPSTEWPVLIYDRTCAEILKNLFTKSEFITYNIVMSLYLEEDREQANFPVIYFVKCTKEISKIINSDYLNKKYTSFTVCTLVPPEDLNHDITFKIVHMSLKALEERVFITDITNINSVCNILNAYFYLEYTSKDLEKYSNILDDESKSRSGKLILFDRSIDLYTPILHFFTFQPLLEEINITDMSKIYEEYGDTALWKEVRHTHLGDMSDLLKSYVRKVKTQPSDNIKDLMKAVMDAPETLKTNKGLRLFFDLTKECYKKFDYINEFSNIEQKIVTKEKLKSKDVIKALTERKIDLYDKKRIALLYKLSGHEYTERELAKLDENLKNFILENKTNANGKFKPISYEYKYEYEVSKYEPTISVVLREYIKNNKQLIPFYKVEREKNTINSLRRTNLISVKKDINKNNICCIYIKGGVTYEEIKCIYKLTDELGIEFLIGSDSIIKSDLYIK